MILTSLLLSYPGDYNFLGMDVKCNYDNSDFGLKNFDNENCFIKTSQYLQRCIFVLSLGPLHTFVHEVGHALVYKMHDSENSVSIELSFPSSSTLCFNDMNPLEKTLVSVSGPLLHVAFCIAQIYASFALQTVLTPPVALALAGLGALWYMQEINYAISSALNSDRGDFGSIRENGCLHLVAATAMMVGVTALGIRLIQPII